MRFPTVWPVYGCYSDAIMKLLCDIGNTRLKWVLEDDGEFVQHGSCDNDSVRLDQALDLLHLQQPPNAIWVSCVGQRSVLQAFEKYCQQHFGLSVNRLKVTASACGIQNNYAELGQLGVDRWVAAIGARQLVAEGMVVIVDAGTAVTIDVLDQHDCFLGGAILPGLTLMHDSLVARTAGIKSKRIESPTVIGSNTKDCVNSGTHYGFIGAVDHVLTKILQQYSHLPSHALTLLCTGGDGQWVQQHSAHTLRFQPHLVLRGVSALAEGA